MAKVLIVDDTDIVRRALELAVRRMGHEAVSANRAEDALALAEAAPPDLALLDYRMPGMSGADLFRALRRVLRDRCPKVLFVSATPQEEVARDVGPDAARAGYVKKPFHLDDLQRVIAAALHSPASGSGRAAAERRGDGPALAAG
jgi:DNA-binding response OmpR family regulator